MCLTVCYTKTRYHQYFVCFFQDEDINNDGALQENEVKKERKKETEKGKRKKT